MHCSAAVRCSAECSCFSWKRLILCTSIPDVGADVGGPVGASVGAIVAGAGVDANSFA